MVRKSRRELEQAVEGLDEDSAGVRTDLARGVTADFVTYEDGVSETAPDGWTWSKDSGGEPTYYVATHETGGGRNAARGDPNAE